MTTPLPQKILDELIEFNNSGPYGRYAAALVMENEGKITVVQRTSEPCYGFLRKYKSTHGDEATQPEQKPGDLLNPFPKGEPLAVAFPWEKSPYSQALLDFVMGPESPWIKGFGGPDNLQKTYKGKKFTGVILLGTDVDPTVMVNWAKFIKNCDDYFGKFNEMVKRGLTEFEALCTITLDSPYSYIGSGPDTYMNPSICDLKRYKQGDANDFSKGTFRNRFDYSRKNIQDIFKDPKGIKFAAEVSKTSKELKLPLTDKTAPYGVIDNYAVVAKKVFKKYL